MTSPDAARAWSAMRTLVLESHDRRGVVADRLQLSFIRAKALLKLIGGPLTMRELGTRLAIDAPYTTVVVDDLERRGLVLRAPSPDDRRVKLVSLTDPGRTAATTAEQIVNSPPPELSALGADDLATLARILTALVPAAGDGTAGAGTAGDGTAGDGTAGQAVAAAAARPATRPENRHPPRKLPSSER